MKKREDTDEESDSEDEDYEATARQGAKGEDEGDNRLAGADGDEAEEEEWDENAPSAEEAEQEAGSEEETSGRTKRTKSKSARRRRGEKIASVADKRKRAPRWSKKVITDPVIGCGHEEEIDDVYMYVALPGMFILAYGSLGVCYLEICPFILSTCSMMLLSVPSGGHVFAGAVPPVRRH